MKRILVASLGLLVFAVPAVSHAATVCFTDSLGRFYTVNTSLACTKNTKQVAVTGKVLLGAEVTCGGVGPFAAVIGACFGNPALDRVVVGLRIIAEGPGCVSQSIHTAGASLGNSSGFFRADGGTNSAITLTP